MAAINLGTLRRPNTVSIFASDPVTLGTIVSFILTDIAIPVPNRVRLDLTRSVGASRSATIARSPLERVVADNILHAPEVVTVTGSLSATPLGLVATRLGGFGSIVRRDLIELEKLRRLHKRSEPVVLITPARVYPSMGMSSIVETHPGSNKVDLSITFEEIRIISPISVAGALDLDAILAGSGSTNNVGAQPTTSVVADVGGGLG